MSRYASHPALGRSLVGGIAAVVIAWAAGTWAADQLAKRRQLERLEAFASQADAQATALKAITARPLHDVRASRRPAQQQLDMIAAELGVGRDGGRRGAPAAAFFRIGQLSLALGDAEAACRDLDTAWAKGLQDPRTALERARAHDLASRDRQRSGLDSPDATVVVESLNAIPADSPLDAEAQTWIAALAAFHGAEPDTAENHLMALETAEALLLRADMALQQARASSGVATLEATADQYRRLITMAPSEPRGYVGLCSAWTDILARALTAAESPPASLGDRAETACADGLIADPTNPPLLIAMARLQRLIAESDRRRGRDPSPSVAATEEAVRRLVGAEHPNLDPAWTIAGLRWLGEARLVRAHWLGDRGENPAGDLQAAEAALQQARALQQRPR